MKIAGVAAAFPRHYYTQEVILETLRRYWQGRLEQPAILERFHRRVQVKGRHLALPLAQYQELRSFGQANTAWIRVAEEVGEAAIRGALERAGLSTRDLSAFFFVSVTGISSPSMDARLMNRMGLPPHLKRVPIFGLGCVAGAAGIARAADYVRSYPHEAALLLSVELCSLTLQREDLSHANLIASALFGDGAAAVIITGSERQSRGPSILGSRSFFYPGTEEVMGWDVSDTGFRIVLSPDVPLMVKQHLAGNVDAFLADFGLRRRDISFWVAHTGGPRVLEATSQALGLPRQALHNSWECLAQVGNLSSASVLLVLEKALENPAVRAGAYGLIMAMGPGFCSELVLIQW